MAAVTICSDLEFKIKWSNLYSLPLSNPESPSLASVYSNVIFIYTLTNAINLEFNPLSYFKHPNYVPIWFLNVSRINFSSPGVWSITYLDPHHLSCVSRKSSSTLSLVLKVSTVLLVIKEIILAYLFRNAWPLEGEKKKMNLTIFLFPSVFCWYCTCQNITEVNRTKSIESRNSLYSEDS